MIIQVWLMHRDSSSDDSHSVLFLPATYYQVQDALEKAHLDTEDDMLLDVSGYDDFSFLNPHLEEADNLILLNSLAMRIAEMESWQKDAFEGLLLMEQEKQKPIGLPRLYDLAANADKCQVLYEATNDAELGRFYAENGFLPELENVPDSVMEILDYGKIGRQMRIGECGVFLRHGIGYVTQTEEMTPVYGTEKLELKAPDYTVLMEVSVPDSECSEFLRLPCEKTELNTVLDRLEVSGWHELSWRCADCRVPALADAFALSDNIAHINYAARMLSELSEPDVAKLKALVQAVKADDLEAAVTLMEQLDEYTRMECTSPAELAKYILRDSMAEREIDLVLKYLNCKQYTKEVVERSGAALTPYGLIYREDGRPVIRQEPEQYYEQEPESSRNPGMTMEL